MIKRAFELIVRDLSWNKVNSYRFGSVGNHGAGVKVTDPSGIGGYEVAITVQSGDVLDYIVKQTVRKQDISLNLAFVGAGAVMAVEGFRQWCARYMDATRYRLTLKVTTYNGADSQGIPRYVDVAFKKLTPSQQQGNAVKAVLVLQAVTLHYSEEQTSIVMAVGISASKYSYTYPYSYGNGGLDASAELSNPFIQYIPLVLTFHGHMSSPEASLIQDGEPYATVRFAGLDLPTGYSLTVDSVNGRIYLTDPDGAETDYYDEVDKTADSFLFAKPGASTLVPSIDPTDASKPSVDLRVFPYTL